jgi:hypothetical protein
MMVRVTFRWWGAVANSPWTDGERARGFGADGIESTRAAADLLAVRETLFPVLEAGP